MTGCHVAALDWATWHLSNQPMNATCQPLIRPHLPPHQLSVLPCHLPHQPATSAADVTRATCHPFSGDMCHLQIRPTVRQIDQICLTRVASSSCHMSPVQTCHVSHIRTCHVSVRTDYTDCTVNNFFTCLTYQTERDIFSIRSPFDKVNIPPESGRRDGRNGTGFVAFRALSFLSIFQALSGFWIRFRITFGPQKVTDQS
jgi:hypothetical protein